VASGNKETPFYWLSGFPCRNPSPKHFFESELTRNCHYFLKLRTGRVSWKQRSSRRQKTSRPHTHTHLPEDVNGRTPWKPCTWSPWTKMKDEDAWKLTSTTKPDSHLQFDAEQPFFYARAPTGFSPVPNGTSDVRSDPCTKMKDEDAWKLTSTTKPDSHLQFDAEQPFFYTRAPPGFSPLPNGTSDVRSDPCPTPSRWPHAYEQC